MLRPLRLVTWNVNGLRAVLQRLSTSLKQFLDELDADIVCLQETKLTRSELDEELVRPPGYDAFYSFCRHRGGYSGVVTFCKSELPTVAAEEGLTGCWQTKDRVGHVGSLPNELSSKTLSELEAEGRCVITDHQAFVLINTYCPALASADRLEYKLQFHALLQDRVRALREASKHVIVVGDINISHREIDHCDPDAYRHEGGSFGDHPCRKWMDSFVCSAEEDAEGSTSRCQSLDATPTVRGIDQLVDVFRHFHRTASKAFTCWNTVTGARQTNYGTRIDYILADPELLGECVTSCSIDPERLGSDHCPVVMTAVMQFETDAATNVGITAAMCAKNFIEFSGTQQSIKSFFARGQRTDEESTSREAADAVAAPRKRPSSGQRSITSFFTRPEPGPKRTSTALGKEARADGNPSMRRILGGSASFVAAGKSRKRKSTEEGRSAWQQVLSGRPPPTPLCHCGQATVVRSVLKVNENWGRKFYVCTKPAGEKGNPEARCDFFQWADHRGQKKPKAP